MNKLVVVALVALSACQEAVAPVDIHPLAGQYVAVSVDGKALPADLKTSDTLTVRVQDWTVMLYNDGRYFSQLYFYEIRPGGSKGIPLVSEGRFTVVNDELQFVADRGEAPKSGSVIGGKLFLSRNGILAGQFGFDERLILPPRQ